jgi:hypothetical protein
MTTRKKKRLIVNKWKYTCWNRVKYNRHRKQPLQDIKLTNGMVIKDNHDWSWELQSNLIYVPEYIMTVDTVNDEKSEPIVVTIHKEIENI